MKTSQTRDKASRRKPSRTVSKTQNFVLFLFADAQLIAIASLVMVSFACYANTLGNEFVFDDIYLVSNNPQIRNLGWHLLWNTYRPLRDVSYAIDFAFWGDRAAGFHLTNIFLHTANVLLVFALIRRLTKDLLIATIAALIFAVHPIQTDAVTYISGRRDLLFSFFYLLAFHAYLSYDRARWSVRAVVYFSLFFVSWAASLLSKEMGASLPILIFVWHFCQGWEPGPNWGRQVIKTAWKTLVRDKWMWLLLVLAGIAFSAYWVLVKGASQRVRSGNIEYWGDSFYLNILTMIRVHAWYLKQLVYPTPIAQYLGAFEVSTTLFDWRVLVSLIVVGGVLIYGFVLLNRDKLMAFAIFSYFVMLLPVSQFIPHHELLADHYLYLPIVSFALFFALLVRKIANSGVVDRKVPYLVVGAAVLMLAVMTIAQNRVWKDERTLWTANYKAVPYSPRAALNLGNTYQETEPEKAAELFKRALGLNPTPEIRRSLNDRLAVILIDQKKFDEAEFFVSEALKKSPEDFFGNLWASQIFIARKDCDKAMKSFSLALAAAKTQRENLLAERVQRRLFIDCIQNRSEVSTTPR